MRKSVLYSGLAALTLAAAAAVPLIAQSEGAGDQPVRIPLDGPDGARSRGARPADRSDGGGRGAFGGPGGPMRQQPRNILKQFDADKNGYLDKQERTAARDFLKKNPTTRPGFGGRGPGGPGGFGRGNREPAAPGPKLSPDQVQKFDAETPLYDPDALRTLFFEFDSDDFEAEMMEFRNTDVEVPATLIVDGKTYENVGVRFRGASSLMMVPQGYKKSLNVSIDYVNDDQRLYGYKTLNLLNSNDDPSLIHAILYFQVARQYIPVPKANLAKVVINGESWGIYPNVQQFNSEFIKEHFGTTKGARWKVPGSPRGGGGLVYVGDDVEQYKQRYEIKSKDRKEDWEALIELCRVIDQTPVEELHTKLEPMLDLDNVLWFLALENVLINSDGYWIRDSDYNIYRDEEGKFHLIPHDANETFGPGGGPGFGGGRGGRGRFGPFGGPGGPGAAPGNPDAPRPPEAPRGPGGAGPGGSGMEIDPLVALDDDRKPLRSRLLKNPALRERYLRNVRTLATEWLDWDKLGPIAKKYHDLIDEEVAADTRKLASLASFESSIEPKAQPEQEQQGQQPRDFRRAREVSLKDFADKRRAYLLGHEAIRNLGN